MPYRRRFSLDPFKTTKMVKIRHFHRKSLNRNKHWIVLSFCEIPLGLVSLFHFELVAILWWHWTQNKEQLHHIGFCATEGGKQIDNTLWGIKRKKHSWLRIYKDVANNFPWHDEIILGPVAMWHLMLEKDAAYVGASKVVKVFAERLVFFGLLGSYVSKSTWTDLKV